ncbi:alpha/beta hydrolase family protein [Andreprevotia chitinilytica]|uniref:alpha/beta hydrolase family protein n=1 Tax=Andreprevotia chitinilytica TaxID=396808 RepID=UPI00068F83E5|nr:hypothetical protein [Andreprevotia chitinilytica]
MRRLFALLFLVAATLARAEGYAQHGPLQVRTVETSWTDPARQREIPLKLYVPEGNGTYPVILFSHGLGGSRDGGAAWGKHWASWGFISIHLQHAGSDKAIWRGGADNVLKAANASQLQARVQDVKFVLDELARRQGHDALLAHADLHHIGMSGHSFGAATTLALAGERYPLGGSLIEPRFAAFIAFSPSATGQFEAQTERFAGFNRPFFSVTGTHDADPLGRGMTPEMRTWPYQAMPAGDKYLLVMEGKPHLFFNGSDNEPDAAASQVVKAATAAFWLANLSGDNEARAWLRSAKWPGKTVASFATK